MHVTELHIEKDNTHYELRFSKSNKYSNNHKHIIMYIYEHGIEIPDWLN